MEGEYVAHGIATQEAIWLRHFLQNLNLTTKVDDPVVSSYNNATGSSTFVVRLRF